MRRQNPMKVLAHFSIGICSKRGLPYVYPWRPFSSKKYARCRDFALPSRIKEKEAKKMNKKAEIAKQLFIEKKYNCAQAVACAFCAELGLEQAKARALASCFGGGMGRLREVCGAVSGALLVLGAAGGDYDPADRAAKAAQYARVQEFARRFQGQNGSIVCRELLGLRSGQKDAPVPEERTKAYYAGRPCAEIVASAAEILQQMLEEQAE